MLQCYPATIYVLAQRSPNSLDGAWRPCAAGHFESLVRARIVADEIELETGKRVAIDAIHPDGRTERVYGPPRDDD